jgi:hypothetical protein
VYAATLWDDAEAEGWTVMGRLRARQDLLRNHAIQARRRQDRRHVDTDLPAVAFEGAERDAGWAEWHGSTELLALLFAPPDSTAMRVLSSRLEYFDVRTGDTWSLFFPGYYERDATRSIRRDPFLGVPRERSEWAFAADGFDSIREHVSEHSEGRWRYSGETDIVLIGAWLPEDGDIVIDWGSLTSGVLVESGSGQSDRSLGALVESISNSFNDRVDLAGGTASLLAGNAQPSHTTMLEFTTQVLSGVATAVLVHGLRLAGTI